MRNPENESYKIKWENCSPAVYSKRVKIFLNNIFEYIGDKRIYDTK